MRRWVVVLMLGLGVFAGLAPILEAIQCEQACVGDSPDGACSQDQCCSCCLHFRVDPPRVSITAPVVSSNAAPAARLPRSLPWPDPRDILHVPKPILL
jgi:hypothetical protein